jgi:cobalt-zinc-cadmium resistance protein CzcA
MLNRRSCSRIKKDKSFFLPFILVLLLSQAGFTQTRLSFPAVYDIALQNNLQLRAADLQISGSRTLSGSWNEIPKTGLFAENEDQRPSDPKGILKIGVSQSLEWPGVYKARKNLLQQQVTSFEVARSIRALEIKRDVQSVYYNLWYLQSRQALWQRLDSIYTSLAQAAFLRYEPVKAQGSTALQPAQNRRKYLYRYAS